MSLFFSCVYSNSIHLLFIIVFNIFPTKDLKRRCVVKLCIHWNTEKPEKRVHTFNWNIILYFEYQSFEMIVFCWYFVFFVLNRLSIIFQIKYVLKFKLLSLYHAYLTAILLNSFFFHNRTNIFITDVFKHKTIFEKLYYCLRVSRVPRDKEIVSIPTLIFEELLIKYLVFKWEICYKCQ